MPELPQVEYTRRYVDATSLHKPVERAKVHDEDLVEGTDPDELESSLVGEPFEKAVRHGKHLFVAVDRDGWLGLHFGMTGDVAFWREEDEVPEYLALEVEFRDGDRFGFTCSRRLGKIRWVERLERFVDDEDLGPDVLADEFEWEVFDELLEDRRGYLKSALMDQHLMAGIGNEYADEILFQSGFHPETKAPDLDRADRRDVYETLRKTLQTHVARFPDLERLADDHLVPNREKGGECPDCGTELETVEVVGRNSYFCPSCQSDADG